MNILGIHISYLSGIWYWAAFLVLYPIGCLFFWSICAAAGKADERIWK